MTLLPALQAAEAYDRLQRELPFFPGQGLEHGQQGGGLAIGRLRFGAFGEELAEGHAEYLAQALDGKQRGQADAALEAGDGDRVDIQGQLQLLLRDTHGGAVAGDDLSDCCCEFLAHG